MNDELQIIEPTIAKPTRTSTKPISEADAFLLAEEAAKAQPTPIVEDPKWPRQPRNDEVRPTDWDQFNAAVMAARNRDPHGEPIPHEYHPPPPRTSRQQQALEEEMAAGKARVARNEQERIARVIPPPDPGDGFNVPVFRPKEYTHEKILNKVKG